MNKNIIKLKKKYSKNNKYNIILLFNKKYLIIFFFLYSILEINKLNNYEIIKNIRIGIISSRIKNGGVEKQTSLLLNNLNKIDKFKLFLFIKEYPSNKEYIIDKNIERIIIKNNLIDKIKEKKIEIAIYQNYDLFEIKEPLLIA